MKRFLLSAALLVVATTAIQAHTLDGIVKDNKTGEPLIGTVIRVKELPNVSTTTGLDGTFTLHELPDKGKVTIIVSCMSYKTREMVVDVAKDFSKDGKEGKDGQLTIAMDEDQKQLGEVVVTGHREYRSDRSAIETVKNAGNVLNVMSQQSIQLSPDVNVASVLQRVSGVTMERDASGEASYAILRGMDKRYNYTLVNGVKIPSPDDKNRYIPLNIFPSDLMDRLVVSKSLTADMEGDAAGGVLDMVMKDAPSHFHHLQIGYRWIRYLQEILSELFKKRVKLMPHSLSLLRKLSKLCSTNCRASYSGINADVGIIILKASPSI